MPASAMPTLRAEASACVTDELAALVPFLLDLGRLAAAAAGAALEDSRGGSFMAAGGWLDSGRFTISDITVAM